MRARAWLGVFRRWTWQRTSFLVYDAPRTTGGGRSVDIVWIGLGHLARANDAEWNDALPGLYESMRSAGDAALLACTAGKELLGWAWVKRGPYIEEAGVGFVRVPQATQMIRFLEVRPESRGRGTGRALLGEIVSRLAADNAHVTRALVGVDNAVSRHCFQESGFVVAGLISTRRVAGVKRTSRLPQVATK